MGRAGVRQVVKHQSASSSGASLDVFRMYYTTLDAADTQADGKPRYVLGLATSEETVARTIALAERMGKTPIPANDRAGFVSNRVLMPLINEAFCAWMEGVAEPEAIDEIMKLGCNFPMGPLRLADFIGAFLSSCAGDRLLCSDQSFHRRAARSAHCW